ncbi:C39 family peptidase [Streptococcus sp. 10F2]
MSHKVIAGLALATASIVTTGVVEAEEVESSASTIEISNGEMVVQSDVTQLQVEEAKVHFEEARQDVVAQEAVVKEIESVKDQAQIAVIEGSLSVTETQKLVEQANPETIAEAQESVTRARQNVTVAEGVVAKEQERAQIARQDTLTQEVLVENHQARVIDAEAEVSAAKKAIEVLKKGVDQTSVQEELRKAEAEVITKTARVNEAQVALEDAKKADALLDEKRVQAQENLSQKMLVVEKTESLLNQIASEMSKEAVSTSFEDHAYYNQRDAVWASYYGNGSFAATGCVPAVLAMVFTELERRGVTPKQVADYLYNNTDYFNKSFSGTSAHGIIAASEHFGFVPTQLSSQAALVAALQEGHHVVGAVQNNKFSPWGSGYSHEVVMKGYSNGKTYIYDPYNRANIGWYPVASMWAEQSQDRDDRALGVPFFKITTQKMADLEGRKVQATKAVQTANRQLVEAKQEVAAYQVGSEQVPKAEVNLRQATLELDTAKENLLKTQEVVRLASQELDEREAALKEAQSNLALKEASLEDAKVDLIDSKAKLESLKSVVMEAEKEVVKAEQALIQAKQDLVQKEEVLSGLEQATEKLVEAKEKLAVAKLDLDQKNQNFEQAKGELERLKTAMLEAESKYQALMTAYQAKIEEKHTEQLLMDYQSLVASGSQVLPVVDETGKVTAYVKGNSSKVVISSPTSISTKGMSDNHQEESSNETPEFISLKKIKDSRPLAYQGIRPSFSIIFL